MRIVLSMIVAFVAAAMITLPEAEAKRFGGGKNIGSKRFSYSQPNQSRPAQSQSQPAQGSSFNQRNGAAPAQAGGMSRWLGPIAGLAAGGLLAAMFFGGGFEGIQFFDILLIGLLIFGGFMLFRMLRRNSQQPQPAPAGNGPFPPPPPPSNQQFQSDGAQAGFDSTLSENSSVAHPDWFDEARFLEGAKGHFTQLQALWDEGNLDSIKEYCTPEFFEALQQERANHSSEQQTSVVSLQAQLLGLQHDQDQGLWVATVSFNGLIREENGGDAQSFNEMWEIQRSDDDAQADWFIAGIHQA